MSNIPNLVIYYHSPCQDGYAAAWAIKHNLSKVKTSDKHGSSRHNIIYKPSLPGCEDMDNELITPVGSEFWFVDLMPSVNKFQELINYIERPKTEGNNEPLNSRKNRIVVLDHHKSNLDICTQITAKAINYNKSAFYDMKINSRTINSKGPNNSLTFIFDMTRSGCQIAWDWITTEIHGSPLERPWFIDYIADRDLWAWQLPNSRLINSAFTGMGLCESPDSINQLNTFTTREQINKYIDNELIPFAKVTEKINDGLIRNAMSKACACSFVVPSGKEYQVWLGNILPELRSDLGNQLCKTKLPDGSFPDLAVIWNYDYKINEWQISLRSIGKKVDCAKIASEFTGGGGHFNAAGFSIKNVEGASLYYYFVPL